MKSKFLKEFKNKVILVFFLIIITNGSALNAEEDNVSNKKWSIKCGDNKDLNSCVIAIHFKTEDPETKKLSTTGTAFIQKRTSKQQVMNLVDKEKGTYKLTESEKFIHTLFIHFPFKIDLRVAPAVLIEDKMIGNMQFQYCSVSIGCKAGLTLNNELIELLKKGNSITIGFNAYRSKKTIKMIFPLKGFTKAYKKLN